MYIVLGATGHIGSAVVEALLGWGEPVTIVTRDARKAADWKDRGADAAIVDVADIAALRAVFRTGRRAFLLNPPAPVSTDTDVEEHRTAAAIAEAVRGSGLEKIVAQSAYGAQPGTRCGDLSVLYDFEQALAATGVPMTVQRGAYFMSNWDDLLDAARAGTLPTMLPADVAIPMVAPADLGRSAARLLRAPADETGLRYVEGPERYAPRDVATAFAAILDRPVTVDVIPPEGWIAAYRKLGFSAAAADSYARMTKVSIEGGFDMPTDPDRGPTTLETYIAGLVKHADTDPETRRPAVST